MKPRGWSSWESFSMLIPGCTVTVRSSTSISRILFMSLTSTRIPCFSGTAPSVSPVPPARGTTGTFARFASLTTSEICSAEVGRTTACGTNSSHLCAGNGDGTRARLKSAERPVNTCSSPQIATSSSISVSGSAATAISDLESGCLGHELEDVEHLDSLLLALLAQGPLRPWTRGDESVDAVEGGRSGDSPAADLCGQLRLLGCEVRARAGAVRPLRDVVDVDERQAGDRSQDLARGLPFAEALVQPARVVVGDGTL